MPLPLIEFAFFRLDTHSIRRGEAAPRPGAHRCAISHGNTVTVVDRPDLASLVEDHLSLDALLLIHVLKLSRLQQEVNPTSILAVDAHVKECDNLVCFCWYALIEHLFRILAFLSQLLEYLVCHDLLAFDESVGEVVEPSLLDLLIELESVCFEQPEGHFSLSIFDSKRQAIFKIFVLIKWITIMLT